MRGKCLILPLLAFLLPYCALAQHKERRLPARKEVAVLSEENQLLRKRVDSLQRLADSYRTTLDSLANLPAEVEMVDTSEFFEISDSLMHMWLVQQRSINSPTFDMEGEKFTSDVPDEIFVQRLADMNSFIPLPFNNTVKNYLILYSEKMRDRMGHIISWTEYYWPIFDEIFSHYNLPLELKALSIVESMLRPDATSRVGAKGLWQFMYGTAKGYGLHIDSWMDERMDPVKSTIAAARYLRDAYNVFGDWYLAIASYNCGAGNVNKAIRRSGGSRDFWQIYNYLPRETRGYVPAFVGALYATHYYREYGIMPRELGFTVPVDTFHITRNLHFEQIDSLVGVGTTLLAQLNPQYPNRIIPGDKMECVLRIPMEYSKAFIDAGEQMYEFRRDRYFNPVELKKIEEASIFGPPGSTRVVYKVKQGDVLGRIASRHHVTVAQIKQWNGLKSNTIRVGQKLVIYKR